MPAVTSPPPVPSRVSVKLFYKSIFSLKSLEQELTPPWCLFADRTHVSCDIKGDVAVVRFNTPNSKVLKIPI